MLSLLLSLSLSANLLGLKVSTGRSGVSLLLQETNTPLLSCVAHRSCLVILSPFSARLYSFISSLQRVLWSGSFHCRTTCKTSWKWRKKWTRSDLDQWFRWAAQSPKNQQLSKLQDPFTVSWPPWWYLAVCVCTSLFVCHVCWVHSAFNRDRFN